MHKAQVYAKYNRARIAPKKVAVVMDMIRNASLQEAKRILAFDPTKAAKMILKVVKSAEANAANNHNLDPGKLYVSDVYVNQGRMQKWGRPSARGKFSPRLRRTSHIVVGLSQKHDEKQPEKAKKGILGGKSK